MTRHSRSLFFSIILHGVLLSILFFTWENVPVSAKKENKKVCVELCSIVPSVPVEKPIERLEPKVVPPKPIVKKVEKAKVAPKPMVKKVQTFKKTPPVVKEIVKEELIKEAIKEEPKKKVLQAKPTQTIEKKTIKKTVVIEDPQVEQKRLEKEYIEKHINKIVQLLQENLYYPRRARKRGIIGEVLVKFTLAMDAKVYSIEVLSSKSDILSRAAIKTIEDLSGKFPKPNKELTLNVPINYTLTR